MKVTTERLPKSLVALNIELDQQQVSKGLDRAARKLSQQYRIPGFRPGKAPRFIVENYLGRERILEEASDDLMNVALKDALKAESLTPVGQVKLDSFEAEPFHFRVLVPVEPTVELAPYTAFRMPLEQEPVSEESVQKLLDAQREQHVVLKSLESPRPAQAGDLISVRSSNDLDDDDDESDDLDTEDGDAPLDQATAQHLLSDVSAAAEVDLALADEDIAAAEGELEDEDEDVELPGEAEEVVTAADDFDDEDEADESEEGLEKIVLEEGRTRPEFLEALVGAQPGDTRVVTVTYGDDETNEALRGKTVTYTLDVEQVQERILPEWDELPTLVEFEGDIEGMRANARERLEHAASEKARRAVLDRFIERAIAESTIDIPDALIEERATELFHEQVNQFQRYGLTEDQLLQSMGKTHEEAVGGFSEQAERDLRTQLVLREIIKRENITLDDAEVTSEVEHFLDDYEPARRAELRPMLDAPHMQRMIASTALDRKLRNRIVDLTSAPEGAPEAGHETPQLADLVGTATVPENAPAEQPGESASGELGSDEPVEGHQPDAAQLQAEVGESTASSEEPVAGAPSSEAHLSDV